MNITPPSSPARHAGAVLAIIVASYLMIVVDISIVITGLPRIQDSLGFTAAQLSWVTNAYTLTFGGLLLLGARAGDILGRRRMFILGLSLFTMASVAIGCAPSVTWLLTARAIQGAGAAVLAPSTLALLSTHFAEGPNEPAHFLCMRRLQGWAQPWGWCWVDFSLIWSPGALASSSIFRLACASSLLHVATLTKRKSNPGSSMRVAPSARPWE